MNAILDQAAQHWSYIAPLLSEPTNDDEYDAKVKALMVTLGEVLDLAMESSEPTNLVADRIARQRIGRTD